MLRMYSLARQQIANANAARGNGSAPAVHLPILDQDDTWNIRCRPPVAWFRWGFDSYPTSKNSGFAARPIAPTSGQKSTFDCDSQCKVYFPLHGKQPTRLPYAVRGCLENK